MIFLHFYFSERQLEKLAKMCRKSVKSDLKVNRNEFVRSNSVFLLRRLKTCTHTITGLYRCSGSEQYWLNYLMQCALETRELWLHCVVSAEFSGLYVMGESMKHHTLSHSPCLMQHLLCYIRFKASSLSSLTGHLDNTPGQLFSI